MTLEELDWLAEDENRTHEDWMAMIAAGQDYERELKC